MEGHKLFKAPLTAHLWADFCAALKGIHTVVVPPELKGRLPRETYDPQWRERMKLLQERAEKDFFDDPVAAQLAEFMTINAGAIYYLIHRTQQLSLALQAQNPESVLCHSDIHAGNILVDTNHNLYIVDWDDPILAAKERILMFVGGGVGGIWNSTEEEALFYEGYGVCLIICRTGVLSL